MSDDTRPETPSAPTLHIEGELTIFRAAELLPTVAPEGSADAPVEIDLSRVTEIDTAGVQLLMLAKKRALAQGRPLRLVAHSAVVSEVFELLNLVAFFGDPLVVSPRSSA